MRIKATCCFIVAVLALCGVAWGQTITGNINGRVTDPSGAVVVGAQVTAINLSTNVSTPTTTNKDGLYSLRFLPIGQYSVSVEAKGFSKEVIPSIALEVAQDVEVDASLKVGAASTSVNVDAGTAPILNTSDGTITSTITSNLVNNLPVNGHNFAELTQMVPGSTVADGNQWNGAGQSSPDNSGERVQSFATLPNVNGNRTYTTNFTIDGISIVDTGANLSNGYGTPAYNIAPEAVQEVAIITNVPPAEYGDGATQIPSFPRAARTSITAASATICRTTCWMRIYSRTSAFCPGLPFFPAPTTRRTSSPAPLAALRHSCAEAVLLCRL